MALSLKRALLLAPCMALATGPLLPSAFAAEPPGCGPTPPPPACAAPPTAGVTPPPSATGTTSPPPLTETPAEPMTAAAPSPASQEGLAAGRDTVNVMGDLLYGYRSINFFYRDAGQSIYIASAGATNVSNSAVADNNSPEPRDRISFRYNHFNDAQSVVGWGGGTSQAPLFTIGIPETRTYDVEQYTLSFEKTFFDRQASVELRLPILNMVASHLTLAAGTVVPPGVAPARDPDPNRLAALIQSYGPSVFTTASTPQATLGHSDTEIGNMDLILKGIVYSDPCLLCSAGLRTAIPTGQDVKATVVDFNGPQAGGAYVFERFRAFDIANETWALCPFLAVIATPSPQWYAQGFLEFECPLNKSHFTYSEAVFNPAGSFQTAPNPPSQIVPQITYPTPQMSTPFTTSGSIADQFLMHVNTQLGYWLIRDPERPLITGLVSTLELGYTQTLSKSQVITLPGDYSAFLPRNATANIPSNYTEEPPPQIGSQRRTASILDMTVGTMALLGDRTTLALGFAFPLLSNVNNRTFDWEAQVQLNWYFGGGIGRAPAALR